MSGELVALAAGTVLAVAALAFVLYPLFFTVPRRIPRHRGAGRSADDSAIRALREIEFDRATGKLSDADYAELRRDYGTRALNEMRASALVPVAPPAVPMPAPLPDPVEATARAWRESHRECPTCGVRPESDALYCSTCGAHVGAAF